ncbi:MAG: hypothetical protein ISP56_04745 [Flavobacteriaceae bacterium]|nr:hypothetical protein [Flavobacteriaceae bacterium]
MKIFIIITGFLELLVGLILIINPKIISAYKNASNSLITSARMYGAAAISIAVFAFIIVTDFENSVLHKPFLIVFGVFHFLVSISIIISFYLKQTRDLMIAVLHGLFFFITLYFLINN